MDQALPPREHAPRTAQCALCSVTSTLPELFQRGRIGQQRTGLLCPRCFAERQASYSKWFIEAMCLVAVLGALLWGKGLAQLGLIMLSLGLRILFHCASDSTARACPRPHGARPRNEGLLRRDRMVRKAAIQIPPGTLLDRNHSDSAGGLTYATHRSTRFVRLKQFIFVAAGPLLHVVLLAVAWSVVVSAERSDSLPGSVVWLIIVFDWQTPSRSRSISGPGVFGCPSENCQMMDSHWPGCRSQRRMNGTIRAGLLLLRVPPRLRRDDHAGAIECLQEGLHQYSADISLRWCYALVLLDQEDYDKAARVSDELRQRPELPPESNVLMLNNIAWADLASRKLEKLERARHYSARLWTLFRGELKLWGREAACWWPRATLRMA